MIQLGLERTLRACRPAMLAATAMLPSAVMAQDAPPQAPTEPRWVKVCGEDPTSKKQVCQVVQALTADTGQFIASVNVKTLEGEANKVFAAAILLPATGILLAPGLRAQIDDGKQFEIKYSICFPQICYADMQVDDPFIDAMKAGSKLTLIALSQQAQEAKPIGIPMTLVGFTKAYDGEGMDATAAQAARQDLAKTLEQLAAEKRRKLQEEQQGVAQ